MPTYENNPVVSRDDGTAVVGESQTWMGVYGKSESTTGGHGVLGEARGTGVVGISGTWIGVYGKSEAATGGHGVLGEARGTGVAGVSKTWIGVYGKSESTTGGRGVLGEGFTGVAGHSSTGDFTSAGVYGDSTVMNGNGVVGEANNGSEAYGVWGKSNNGWAGKFDGRVHITGVLHKGGLQFRIDHPLDPENRYLHHAGVESPEQLNVYSGIAVTDSEGVAAIELPSYFEALNTDFRYQLTVIGDFAQAVVSEEVRGNRFAIATDRPEVKVSWQVSGVRQDPFARANPLVVEEEKPENERGTYLHPEAWGKPPEAAANHARSTAFRRKAQLSEPGSAPMPQSQADY